MKIYTLTLNPAYDVHACAEELAVYRENFATVNARDAGGKGVNISRALCAAGVENTAIVVLGKENSAEFKESLAQYGVNTVCLEKEGRIRENLTVHHGGRETRISFSGFRVDDSLLEEVGALICACEDTVVTFTGSIPDGVSKAAAKKFLLALKEKGVKLVLDCRSFTLEDIQEVGPWLVKPNQQEVSGWFDTQVISVEQARECAKKLHGMGVENAVVSMGAQGSILACGEVYYAVPPKTKAVSTIGAGDSSLAGFLSAAAEGQKNAQCLRRAVAFGTAACLTEGTQPPKKGDIARILPEITVTDDLFDPQ